MTLKYEKIEGAMGNFEDKQKTKSDTYEITLICTNCGLRTTRKIPKGVSINHYTKHYDCTNCGCTSLREPLV